MTVHIQSNLIMEMTLKIMNRLLQLLLLALFVYQPILFADVSSTYPIVKEFFPNADHFGDFEGEPLAAPVYKGDEVIGYVFETVQVAPIPAYSGKPINILVGMDKDGIIKGSKILQHHEPILLVGIPESKLQDFSNQYTDKKVTDRIKVGSGDQKDHIYVDAISGATVTVLVVNKTIMRAAKKIAISRKLIENNQDAANNPTVRMDHDQKASWQVLTGNGAIRHLYLTREDIDKAFEGKNIDELNAQTPEEKKEQFIDLYYTYLDVPTIGQNLLGDDQYKWLKTELKDGDHAIAVLANGPYSFKGNGFVRGGIFDRVQIEQEQTINFHDLDYYRLSDVYAEGMPEFKEMAIFIIRKVHEFEPALPWSFTLLVRRQTGPVKSIFANFSSEYELPDAYLIQPKPVETFDESEPEPIWVTVWREKAFQIVILVAGLFCLSLILILQDWLVRYPTLLKRIRIGFLIYTVIFIGWYSLAQLSVVNVLTFVNAVMNNFQWETFLIDPLMFILWGFVAVTLLIVGRGVYCGWLCPFGALQDLINQVARYFKVKQWEFPDLVHERLWAIKYVILLGLFAISLQSLGQAERFAEVEPFKTVIILHFQRQWAFLFYGILLLILTVFNHKFYCKYLCPLGAALAIAAKMRLFDWLRRRNECGSPCQLCAVECEVRAIDKTGHINPNECHYCLDCQVTYWHDHKCPPLIAKLKRKEKSRKARESVKQMEKAIGTKSGLDKLDKS